MDLVIYSLLKKYIQKTLAGGGALKGKNCTIQSIESIEGGKRVTFKWTLDNGTVDTDTMDVMNGDDGLGIKSIDIDSKNHLIVTFDDNTTHDAGEIDGGGGSTVVVTPTLSSGTKIAEIDVDGNTVNLFAPSGGGGGSSTLSELTDVDLSTLSDGDVLVYDATSGKWVNESPEDGTLVEAVLSKSVMPTASADYNGIPVLYIGSTSASYTKGHTYVCETSGSTYSWTDVTPSGGTSEDKYKGHDDGFNDSAQQLIAKIGRGWNLGNTLDGHHQQVGYTRASIVDLNNYFETWYKNFKATKKLIHYVKTLGFNAVRLPITWKDHVDYNLIDCEWLKRVEEVVQWVLDEDMYCIINVHHDGIYYEGSTAPIVAESNLEIPSTAYLNNLWYQIADYFKDYNSKVIFATMNEILDSSGRWSNMTSDSLNVVNSFNQSVVDTIRSSGGNNAERFCICPTYGASCGNQALSAYELPTDIANNKLIAEVHYYPTTVSEIAQIFSDINSVLIQNDIPVIVGEYGVIWNADAEAIVNKIVEQADLYNIPLFYWDNGGTYRIVDRYTLDVDRPALIEAITDEEVDPVDYTYPMNIPSMPYYCKMYSADSNSTYGGKYIVICSQYPITDFIPIANDDSGYYQIVRDNYGAMAYFTSDDDITYHVLWSFLDNDRSSYMRSKVVLGSTANMEYVEGNYTITGWSDEPSASAIEWTKEEALPSEVTSDNNSYTLDSNGLTFTAINKMILHTNNSSNAEFEVTMSVPSTVSTHGGEANMILRANGKHIGSLQFQGDATIYNSSTDQKMSITAGTLYKLKERIENGVGYVYVNDNLLGTVTTLRDTSGLTCDFGGFEGVKVTHFKYMELA